MTDPIIMDVLSVDKVDQYLQCGTLQVRNSRHFAEQQVSTGSRTSQISEVEKALSWRTAMTCIKNIGH